MSQSELLKKTIAGLEAANTPYMLTGSFASSLRGEPRLTHDIDLVVAITPASNTGVSSQTLRNSR
jgi:predicted nucleotidyltransferase